MVKIRLRRVGAKKQPSYRVVVTDSRSPRDGRFIEIIGHYNPRTDPPTVVIHEDRALYWLSVGAQPSDAVAGFFSRMDMADKLKQVHGGAKIETVAAPRATAKPAAAEAPAEAPTKAPAKAKAKPAAAAEATAEATTEAAAEVTSETTEAVAEAAQAVTTAPAAAEVEVAEEAPAAEVAAKAPASEKAAAAKEAPAAEVEVVAKAPAAAKAAAAKEAPAADDVAETAPMAGGLEGLGLSGRVVSALDAAGITTVPALAAKAAEGDDALSAIPGIGAKAVEEIRQKLAAAGA